MQDKQMSMKGLDIQKKLHAGHALFMNNFCNSLRWKKLDNINYDKWMLRSGKKDTAKHITTAQSMD